MPRGALFIGRQPISLTGTLVAPNTYFWIGTKKASFRCKKEKTTWMTRFRFGTGLPNQKPNLKEKTLSKLCSFLFIIVPNIGQTFSVQCCTCSIIQHFNRVISYYFQLIYKKQTLFQFSGHEPINFIENKEKTLRASYDRDTQIVDYMD